MILEIFKFVIYLIIIIVISKYILVKTLRSLAESLNLKSKNVGKIAGYATSMPELLTVTISSFKGLSIAGIYNIVSSNVINLVQYFISIFANKNQRVFENKAIKVILSLAVFTILIPLFIILFSIEINMTLVPLFVILYLLFSYINSNVHKLYLEDNEYEILKAENKTKKNNIFITIKYTIYLIISGILLFVAGNLLGNTLESLCNIFNVPEWCIGVLLGFATSIPELITFFEAQKHHKKNKDSDEFLGIVEATNNLYTSNVLNLFVIQTIGILIVNIF